VKDIYLTGPIVYASLVNPANIQVTDIQHMIQKIIIHESYVANDPSYDIAVFRVSLLYHISLNLYIFIYT
jgi:hypothetical protein